MKISVLEVDEGVARDGPKPTRCGAAKRECQKSRSEIVDYGADRSAGDRTER